MFLDFFINGYLIQIETDFCNDVSESINLVGKRAEHDEYLLGQFELAETCVLYIHNRDYIDFEKNIYKGNINKIWSTKKGGEEKTIVADIYLSSDVFKSVRQSVTLFDEEKHFLRVFCMVGEDEKKNALDPYLKEKVDIMEFDFRILTRNYNSYLENMKES